MSAQSPSPSPTRQNQMKNPSVRLCLIRTSGIVAALIATPGAAVRAQDATLVYRLGHDTVAVEQFTRTPTRFTGETVVRSGPTVSRTQYDITLVGGKATAAVLRRRQADGSPIPN